MALFGASCRVSILLTLENLSLSSVLWISHKPQSQPWIRWTSLNSYPFDHNKRPSCPVKTATPLSSPAGSGRIRASIIVAFITAITWTLQYNFPDLLKTFKEYRKMRWFSSIGRLNVDRRASSLVLNRHPYVMDSFCRRGAGDASESGVSTRRRVETRWCR